jgi:hypothetical protein
MSDDRDYELVKSPRTPSPTEKDSTSEETDSDFQARLHAFPDEIRESFKELPPKMKRKILSEAPERKGYTQLRQGGKVQGFRMGTPEDLREMILEMRHARNEWTADEIDEMDSVQREILFRRILIDFMTGINVDERLADSPEELLNLMNVLWGNRNDDDLVLYRHDYFKDLRAHQSELLSNKRDLLARLDKARRKKGATVAQRRQFEADRRTLADEYGLIFENDGKTYPVHSMRSDQPNDIARVSKELEKEKPERTCQETLAILMKYSSSAEFSVLMSEMLDRRQFGGARRDTKATLQIASSIEDWYQTHRDNEAIISHKEKNPTGLAKQEALIQHFWRLFTSYERNLQYRTTSSDELRNMTRELEIIIRMLT